MATWLGRHIDDDLWNRFKARAASEGRSLRWVMLTLIAYYADQGLPPAQPTAQETHPS